MCFLSSWLSQRDEPWSSSLNNVRQWLCGLSPPVADDPFQVLKSRANLVRKIRRCCGARSRYSWPFSRRYPHLCSPRSPCALPYTGRQSGVHHRRGIGASLRANLIAMTQNNPLIEITTDPNRIDLNRVHDWIARKTTGPDSCLAVCLIVQYVAHSAAPLSEARPWAFAG